MPAKTKKKAETTAIMISNENELLQECNRLGGEIRNSQKQLLLTVHTSIQHAREIGRIASEAKECIAKLPTKAQKNGSTKNVDLVKYKKPSFEDWILTHTTLSKDTIYAMMKLHMHLESNPNFKTDGDMSWREVLGHFNKQSLLKKSEIDTIDVDAEEIEDDEDNPIEDGKSNGQQRIEKEKFNKLRDKVNKLFTKFLKDFENSEYQEQIIQWQELITDDSSQAS